jgi:DNA-binding NarL/FixJ family response regulator
MGPQRAWGFESPLRHYFVPSDILDPLGPLCRMKRNGALGGISAQATMDFEARVHRLEIPRRLGGGLRSAGIAKKLHVSEGTVKTHLHRIYEKLRVDGRVQLILLAREKGIA